MITRVKASLDRLEGWIALAAGAAGLFEGVLSLPTPGGWAGLVAGALGVVQGAVTLVLRKGGQR